MSNISNHARILKNTLFIYFRMIVILGVTLYTSRVILNVLGVEDFGLYNVVGGIITMMAFLSGAMSSATQRFFSFELGKGDAQKLHNIFKMSINIHFIIILCIIITAETVGLWFINTKLNIQIGRLSAANWVYQCSVFSFCCAIISVPYNAAIISHEKMSAFVYISIVDVLLKLAVILLLITCPGDKLKLYAKLMAISSIITFGCYYIYARWQFEIARFSLYWDSVLFKTLLSYTGWNLFGNLAGVMANQGVNILLNLFFGATINAARSIAFQVSNAITGFVNGLQVSINPQIVKLYANKNIHGMLQLVFSGARYSFFLLYFLSIPFLLQTDLILKLWLGVLPNYASCFCRLVIIDSLVVTLSGTLMTAFQATGKIKKYQVIVGFIIFCNLPISYIFLRLGFDAQVTMLVAIYISVIALVARVILLSFLFPDVKFQFMVLLFRVGVVFLISFNIASIIPTVRDDDFFKLILYCSSYWIIVFLTIISIGIDKNERGFLISKSSLFLEKIRLVNK